MYNFVCDYSSGKSKVDEPNQNPDPDQANPGDEIEQLNEADLFGDDLDLDNLPPLPDPLNSLNN